MTTKQAFIRVLLVALIIFKMGDIASAQQTASAKKWVKSRKWTNGIKLKADTSINADEFYRQYQASKTVWDKAFMFIKTHNLDTISVGRYVIDGDNAYAIITEGPSKTPD